MISTHAILIILPAALHAEQQTVCGFEHCEVGKCPIQCNLPAGFYCDHERPQGFCCCHDDGQPGYYQNCPPGLYFDPVTLVCNHPENVDYTQCANRQFQCGQDACDNPPCEISCDAADGYRCDPNDPAGFCFCGDNSDGDGKGSFYSKCPPGLLFDPVYGQCNVDSLAQFWTCPGYQGDPCNDVTCQNGGTCSSNAENTDYTCINCDSGYSGKTCDILDPCFVDPCQNGGSCTTLDSTQGTYSCSCPAEFSGQNCEYYLPCSSSPCLNGATCENVLSELNPGQASDLVVLQDHLKAINQHKSSRAYRTRRQVKQGANIELYVYACLCTVGFKGDDCGEAVVNPCGDSPCENGATCQETAAGNDYTCLSCPADFTGKNCNVVVPCSLNPCKNGGTCIDDADFNGFTCENCGAEYTGSTCETPIPCSAGPCKNGGTCFNDADFLGFTCENCDTGYTGTTCETPEPCGSGPCKNGGTCTNDADFNGFSCSNCDPGFTGPTCEKTVNPCQPNPCQNGGDCVNAGDGQFGCLCVFTPGVHAFTGPTCEVDLYSPIAIGKGDPHYVTYDGPTVHNQAQCQVTMTKLCDYSDMEFPWFSAVAIQKYHDDDVNEDWGVSYVRGFVFYWEPRYKTNQNKDKKYRFKIVHTRRTQFRMYVDGALASSNNGANGYLEPNKNFGSIDIALRVEGKFTVLYFGVGWMFGNRDWAQNTQSPINDYLGYVKYHHKLAVVESQLNSALAGKVCGMWGDYNGIKEIRVEKKLPEEDKRDFELFLHNQWAPASCPSKLGPIGECAKKSQYQAKCEALNDAAFSACEKGTGRMIEDCVYDLCVSNVPEDEVVCEMMETYVSRCNANDRVIKNWRNANRCPLDCPANANYQACAKPACKENMNQCTVDQAACDVATCVEACVCKAGYIQNGYGPYMECLKKSETPCPCPEFDAFGNCVVCSPSAAQLKQWDSDGFGTKSIHGDSSMWETSKNEWRTTIFRNKLSQTVKLYWLKYNDKDEQLYKTLAAGASYGLESSNNHKWIFRTSSGQALAICDVISNRREYILDQSKVDYYNEEGIC